MSFAMNPLSRYIESLLYQKGGASSQSQSFPTIWAFLLVCSAVLGLTPLQANTPSARFAADEEITLDGATTTVLTWGDTTSAIEATAVGNVTQQTDSYGTYLNFDGSSYLDVTLFPNIQTIVYVYAPEVMPFPSYGAVLGLANDKRIGTLVESGQTYLHFNQFPDAVWKNGETLTSPYDFGSDLEPYVAVIEVKTGTTSGETNYRIGGSGPYRIRGKVYEILVYDGLLSETDRLGVESALLDVYNPTVYHPDASWITASYDADFQAQIHAKRLSFEQAERLWANRDKAIFSGIELSSYEHWYSSDKLSNNYTTEGDIVTTWPDEFGGEAAVIDSSVGDNSSNQPEYRVDTASGQPGVYFGERYDQMQTGFEHTDHDDPFTLVFVYRLDNDSGIYNNRVTRNNSLQIGRGASEGDYSVRILNNVRLGNSGSRVEDVYTDRFVIHSYSYSGSANGTHTHWIDGELQGTTDFLQEIGRLPLGESGSGHYTQGTISEVLIFSEALDQVQVDEVSAHFAEEYGLYHPDAAWITAGYDADFRTQIHAKRLSFEQAERLWANRDKAIFSGIELSSYEHWYSSDKLSNNYTTEGDIVTTWPDEFGGEAAVIDSSVGDNSSNQPEYRVDTASGQPGVYFGERYDQMQTGFEHTDHDDPFTLVFVYRLDNDSGIYNNRVTRNNSLQIGRGASEGDYSVRILNNVRLGNSGSRVEDVYTDRFVIHSYSYSGSANGTHTHWIDGELQGTTDFLQEIGRLPLGESGSGHYTQGTISEVLIFSEALDPMQVDAVTIQLADIHGIYVPNATWIQAFTPSEQAIIHASRYTRSQFEARKAIQDASTEINISDTLITGVAAWYRQEELIQHEEGDAVGVWPDAFGQWPLENASGNTALSPTFRANSLNGFSGLDFDNVDDRLNGTYNHPYNSDSPITVVAVYAQKSIDGNNRILTNDRNNFQFAGRYETNAYRALGAGDWLDEGEVYIPFVEGKPVIQAYRYDAATGLQESWINDVLIGSHTEQFQIGKIGLGEVISNQEANAYIYELIIFDRLVPDTELDIVEVYFAEKYGLYHPDADWVQGFDVSEQAIIGRSAYSQVEFEARKSLQDASIALASIFNIPDAMIDGVVAWHRPEDLSIYENGASVAFWPDAFGQWPLEYTGGNPAIAPTYQHDVSNGIAALDFDNTDDRLYGTYNHLMSDAHPITVIAVYAQKSINGSNRVLANDRNSFMIAGRYETNGYRAWGAGDWLDDSEQVIPFMANQPVVHSYRYDALTGFQESWLDGSFIGSHTEKFEMGRIGMGEVIANQEANAYIHELIIFDRYLSDTEMDAVEVYFANKYDLVHPSATDRQILIFDLNLEAQLRAAIGVVAPGPIMQSHLNGLTGDFDFSGLGISDLRGIEQLTGITSLNLNGNRLDADFDSDDMAQVQVLLDAGVTVTTDSQETLSIATAVSNPSGGSILITPLKTDYFYGDAVEVVFDLAPGYTFEGWTGDLSGTDHSHAITLEGNVSVSATVSDLGLDLTNLAAWYRPEELSEIGIDPGDEVTTWPDALGNFDLTAPADSRSLVIGAEETLAGYRGLFFENDHDRLNGTFAHASGADSLTVTVV